METLKNVAESQSQRCKRSVACLLNSYISKVRKQQDASQNVCGGNTKTVSLLWFILFHFRFFSFSEVALAFCCVGCMHTFEQLHYMHKCMVVVLTILRAPTARILVKFWRNSLKALPQYGDELLAIKTPWNFGEKPCSFISILLVNSSESLKN